MRTYEPKISSALNHILANNFFYGSQNGMELNYFMWKDIKCVALLGIFSVVGVVVVLAVKIFDTR